MLERCLCHPEELCHNDNLLDPLLSHSQAQRLLHMICYPDISSTIDELDQKSMITRILEVIVFRYFEGGCKYLSFLESRTVDVAHVLVRFAINVQTIR